VAVGLALEQGRPLATTCAADRIERRLAHRPEIVAVHHLRLHAERRCAYPDLTTRRDARHRRELAVEVVLAYVYDREVEHLRPVQALVEVPLVRGAVAEERHRHPALPLRRDGRARRGGDAAAHDAEAAHEPMLEVDHVHRPGAPAADPGGATQHLGRQRLGIGSLCERVAVAAVGPGRVVVRLERRADADRDGLLTRGQMRRAVDVALQEQALNLLLEATDEAHPAVALQVVSGRLAGLILLVMGALRLCPGHRWPLYSNRLQGLGG
jgi:hypothetical protein